MNTGKKITEKIDAVTKIPEEYRREICPPPKSVKIELTARCDLQCFFCANRFKLRTKRDIDFEFYKRIVREMRDSGVEELGVFYLGESMLYPKLFEAVQYAKRDVGFPYVFLTTNGVSATPDKVGSCAFAGLDSLKFSINASSPKQFFENTNVNGFDKVMKNLEEARSAIEECVQITGHRCGLYASSIVFSEEQREQMKDLRKIIEQFVDEYYELPLYNQGGFTKGNVAGNIGRIGALRDPIPCWAIFTEGHITYDGKLSACCFDHDGRFAMGDLTQESFMDAWNSEKFQKLRAKHLEGTVSGTVCEKCIVYG